MESGIVGSNIEMANDIIVDAVSFTWAIDSAIRSSTSSDLGASPLHSFASIVDYAIMSDTSSNFEASPVAENVRTVAARSSEVEVVSNVTRYVGASLFSLAKLKAATNNFSLCNKIGIGSFGVVYRGKLDDGREVAVKRAGTGSKTESRETVFGYLLTDLLSRLHRKYFNLTFKTGRRKARSNRKELQEEFEYLFTLLPRLHHKNLVGLLGFCEEKDERLLVFEHMKNGSLYDHLHDKINVEKGDSVLNNWKMRIKIALDACQGIDYLHNHAVPSIIHRDINSSHILLDDTWTARISDLENPVMSLKSQLVVFETVVVGTLGYLDPEYFHTGVLTAKSDVYGFGVVLFELLTGKRPIFRVKEGEDEGRFSNLVVFALHAISDGELVKILDPRVGPPDVNEAEAVKLVANTAIHCVKLKGEDRPTMTQIALNLERALAICDSSSYDNIFSGTIL